MTDQVARALCEEAGKGQRLSGDESTGVGPCLHCDENGDCTRLNEFRSEARHAILAAFTWHKRERRWPAFCR